MCLLTIHIRAPTPARTLNTAQGYAPDPRSRRESRWPRRLAARRSAGTRTRQPRAALMASRRRASPGATDRRRGAGPPLGARAPLRRALREQQASATHRGLAFEAGRSFAARRRCGALISHSRLCSRFARAPLRWLRRPAAAPPRRARCEPRRAATLPAGRETHERCRRTGRSVLAQITRVRSLSNGHRSLPRRRAASTAS